MDATFNDVSMVTRLLGGVVVLWRLGIFVCTLNFFGIILICGHLYPIIDIRTIGE